MDTLSLYSEARNEYMKQLSTWIVPPLVEFFRREYETISKREGRGSMGAFQDFCSEVPRWNQDVIDTNIGIILDTCRCDYVEELMTAVFIAHTKMLTAIRVSSKQKKLQITLPKLDHFLHRVFVECARAFWKAPFLFDTSLTPIDKQKNVLQAEAMCTDALSGAVRSLLPVKNILRDYLDEDDDEASASSVAQPLRGGGGSSSSRKKAAAAAAAAAASDSDSSDSDSSDDEAPAAAVAAATTVQETHIEKIEAPSATPGEPATLSGYAVTASIPAKSVVIEKVPEAEAASAPAPAPAPAPTITIPSPAHVIAAIKEGETSENPNPPKLMIETEPAVHFTPYDTVYDENTNAVSEIRYSPKLSIEEKPPSTWGLMDDEEDEAPRLQISGGGDALGLDDMVDLEAPAPAPVLPTKVSESAAAGADDLDVDVPFGSTGDFEELT